MSTREWEICPVCRGNGTVVNPAIDCHGITPEEFAEDPEFKADYFAGTYDQVCRECNGLRVIPSDEARERAERRRERAAERRMRAMEDGDWEGYLGAGDPRWG